MYEAGMRFKAVTLGFVLAGTALGSAALTLGRARGAAWIGQSLELVVPVQIDPGQTEGTLCADADVFHGDSRQDSSRVQVQVMPTEQADSFNLKISSNALIDEPVVTVYLRAGCGQKSSRKYVLLADFPNDNAAPLSRTVTATAPTAPLVIPLQAAPVSGAPAAPASPAPAIAAVQVAPKASAKISQTSPAAAPSAAKPATKSAAKEAVKAVAKTLPTESASKKQSAPKVEKPPEGTKPVTAGKSRLRLDPIETLNERVKTLESSTTAGPALEDLARDTQKMQLLQSDLKALLEQAVKNEASLMAMRDRLEQAESDRVPLALVYGLGALVVLCLGALAFLWRRRPTRSDWDNSVLPGDALPARGRVTPAVADDSGQAHDLDVDLVDLDEESFNRMMDQTETEKKKG
jgi:hypothetical protein